MNGNKIAQANEKHETNEKNTVSIIQYCNSHKLFQK